MKKLPKIRVVYDFFRNPDYIAFLERGGDWNDQKAPPFYAAKETLAEVLVWNINSGTMRVRILNEDGTAYKQAGSVVTFNCSDEPFLAAFDFLKEALYA